MFEGGEWNIRAHKDRDIEDQGSSALQDQYPEFAGPKNMQSAHRNSAKPLERDLHMVLSNVDRRANAPLRKPFQVVFFAHPRTAEQKASCHSDQRRRGGANVANRNAPKWSRRPIDFQ